MAEALKTVAKRTHPPTRSWTSRVAKHTDSSPQRGEKASGLRANIQGRCGHAVEDSSATWYRC